MFWENIAGWGAGFVVDSEMIDKIVFYAVSAIFQSSNDVIHVSMLSNVISYL